MFKNHSSMMKLLIIDFKEQFDGLEKSSILSLEH